MSSDPKPLAAAEEIMLDFQDAIDRIIEGPITELDGIHRQIGEQIEIRDNQLKDAKQALEASQQENERCQELARKIHEEGHEAGQGDFWVIPMKYFNTLLNTLLEQEAQGE